MYHFADLKLVSEIPTPSFQFGGRVGRSVTSLIFSPLWIQFRPGWWLCPQGKAHVDTSSQLSLVSSVLPWRHFLRLSEWWRHGSLWPFIGSVVKCYLPSPLSSRWPKVMCACMSCLKILNISEAHTTCDHVAELQANLICCFYSFCAVFLILSHTGWLVFDGDVMAILGIWVPPMNFFLWSLHGTKAWLTMS